MCVIFYYLWAFSAGFLSLTVTVAIAGADLISYDCILSVAIAVDGNVSKLLLQETTRVKR